ncbi:5'-adenylylsulfate reductase-like 5 [Rhododendron vialii]|uniref:5'-adenylylsulfate reductase-like 5 n=1 Tax=Rhododendron vialii TaxID=182163 RepID=UPI00265F8099|nr:5'-adenylylsulfate reductase-like 5 [Rhododendron vialii]
MALPNPSTTTLLFLHLCVAVSSLRSASSAPPPICPSQPQPASFLDALQSTWPLSFPLNSPLEVNGDVLDGTLTSKQHNVYTSVLFYASWCPFSHDAQLIFKALSSMFPQIEHLAVEQSSAMPSVLSRYGIHSLPTFLMVNQTSTMRFRGPKDLHSLVKFYEKITGFEPVHYVPVDQSPNSEGSGKFVMQSWMGASLNEIVTTEPYLLFSLLFLLLRILVFIFPKVVSRFRAFRAWYIPHLNLEIFGETSHVLGRVRQMVNVERIWAKMRVFKTRNFREGAKNARVWASSLASVSLGETSSSRL